MRVAPNELSFNTAQSWRDIYEKRKGQETFIKSDFYDGGNFAAEAHSIVSVRDPEEHAHMRRYLREAFSDRSLRDQEHLISLVIDRFIERIGEKGKDSAGIDIVMWFNLATFDSTYFPPVSLHFSCLSVWKMSSVHEQQTLGPWIMNFNHEIAVPSRTLLTLRLERSHWQSSLRPVF